MKNRIQIIIRYPGFFPAITTLLFAFAIFTGVLPISKPTQGIDWVAVLAKALLALAFLVLAWWFLHAFTHADQDASDKACQAEQNASMFRFAYMFAVYSFALLLLPFTAMLRTHETTPDAGPIRLLRACVMEQQAQPAARSASAGATSVSSPVELCPPDSPLAGTVSYPWLVSVGGVVAQECGTSGFECAKSVAMAASASAPAAAADMAATPTSRAASTPVTTPKPPPMYSVRGGFVVPFYVVVFAFVGGVVNLTRRVPEYQKRSSCNFAGTATESCVSLLEAREFVVFQIMQLVTSPFIAMVAYYALEPRSIASAVGLAFVAGFATESVLLLIRGMVNGLRPEPTRTAASTSVTAQLHVVLHRVGGGSVEATTVELRRLPNASPPIATGTVAAGGEVEFKALQAGTLWVVATLSVPGQPPSTLTASQKVQLQAGQTESIDLTLA